jgi:hypothetical protein
VEYWAAKSKSKQSFTVGIQLSFYSASYTHDQSLRNNSEGSVTDPKRFNRPKTKALHLINSDIGLLLILR